MPTSIKYSSRLCVITLIVFAVNYLGLASKFYHMYFKLHNVKVINYGTLNLRIIYINNYIGYCFARETDMHITSCTWSGMRCGKIRCINVIRNRRATKIFVIRESAGREMDTIDIVDEVTAEKITAMFRWKMWRIYWSKTQ